jgi:hypothetical protein
VRLEDHFQFFRDRFLPASYANSAYPKGWGQKPEKDGTQPFSSFFLRHIYVSFIFMTFVFGASLQNFNKIALIVIIWLDILSFIYSFYQSKKKMIEEIREEEAFYKSPSSKSDPDN